LKSIVIHSPKEAADAALVEPRAGWTNALSCQVQSIEMTCNGGVRLTTWASYLDYRAPEEAERLLMAKLLEVDWLKQDLDSGAIDYAVSYLVPEHLSDDRERRGDLLWRSGASGPP
jgi:hypothetical protein